MVSIKLMFESIFFHFKLLFKRKEQENASIFRKYNLFDQVLNTVPVFHFDLVKYCTIFSAIHKKRDPRKPMYLYITPGKIDGFCTLKGFSPGDFSF